jgi:hypothetical protein
VHRWFRVWRDAWRGESWSLTSPLPVDVVRERLAEGSVSLLRATFPLGGGYRVIGRIGPHRLRLEATRSGGRDAWRPILRGRLEPTATGSRLVGTVGVHPSVKVAVLAMGAALAVALIALCGFGVYRAVRGELSTPDVLAALPPAVVLVFLGGTSLRRLPAGRLEVAYLRSWLTERLRTGETTATRPS